MHLSDIYNFDSKGVALIFLTFGILEWLFGVYKHSIRTLNDLWIEGMGFLTLGTIFQPAIIFTSGFLLQKFCPQYEGYFKDTPWWALGASLLVLDDLVHYAYHRLAHASPWLWKFHKAHHTAPEMGVGTVQRNAALFYAMMPNIWIGGCLIYLGFGKVYMIYIIIKMIVVTAAHSPLKWDSFLYKYRILHPIAWVLERTITTPATHFAHHGLTESDGVSAPNGNFSNLFFFWDVLFGTATITRQYPKVFGVADKEPDPWYVQLFFPIFRSKVKDSELR